MDNGWIKLHRKILKWEWYQESTTFHLFIHLLINASHKDIKWKGIVIERGQLITGRHKLKKETKISEQSIRTSLERLKSTNEITIKTTNRYSIITLCNYSIYQLGIDDGDQHINQHINQQLTSNQPTTNHIQEVKNVKNVKNYKDIYISVVSHLNLICGTKYKPSSKKTIEFINARLNDGFTVEDFKTVIDKKYAEWGQDSKMSAFLRPETLFGNKFESYLNQPIVRQMTKSEQAMARYLQREANNKEGRSE